MDPYSSPYIIHNNTPHNPFPHSLLRIRQNIRTAPATWAPLSRGSSVRPQEVLPLPADEGLRVYVGFRLGFRVKFRGDVDDQVEFHGLMCLVL